MTYPNNSSPIYLVSKENPPTGEIVSNWNAANKPYETTTAPSNGWVNVKTKCRNYESAAEANNGVFTPRQIEIWIDSNRVSRAIAGTTGIKYAVAACTDNMFPVRAGEVIKYGSTGVTPNGKFSEVQITFFPFVA